MGNGVMYLSEIDFMEAPGQHLDANEDIRTAMEGKPGMR